jgi:hypothetical protein
MHYRFSAKTLVPASADGKSGMVARAALILSPEELARLSIDL